MAYAHRQLPLAIFCGLVAAASLNCSSGSNPEREHMSGQSSISNSPEAVARASQLTELNTLTKKITSQRVTVKDEPTPYIGKRYEGLAAWTVEFTDVALKFKSAMPNFADKYKRKFVVLLDEKTGQLISVTSHFDGKDPDLLELSPADSAERQLSEEDEVYHGLPAADPKLTFLDALEVVLNKGIGSPFVAKEIYGNFVLHSRGKSPQRAVWVINLRGLPPLSAHGAHGDSVPIWQRNHMRNVVEDQTATNLFATNSPQP
jgi:hypothetical protein